VRSIGSADVNDYLREAAGADVTAKDFRTWHATVHALALLRQPRPDGRPGGPSAKEILAEVAARLGNTVAVCRKSYVHPAVLELAARGLAEGDTARSAAPRSTRTGLSAPERDLLDFLQRTSPKPRELRTLLEQSLKRH
jgi:DNA topoisomerase-1